MSQATSIDLITVARVREVLDEVIRASPGRRNAFTGPCLLTAALTRLGFTCEEATQARAALARPMHDLDNPLVRRFGERARGLLRYLHTYGELGLTWEQCRWHAFHIRSAGEWSPFAESDDMVAKPWVTRGLRLAAPRPLGPGEARI